MTDPTIPFARVRERLHAADVVFSKLECCFYEPEGERSLEDEGLYAPLKSAEALTFAGVHAVGNANNVNYGAAAIDAGADLVMGHGPHMPLGIEIYQDKPIFYGVGSFSFETGHRARTHPDWIGLMLHVETEDGTLARGVFLCPPQ